MKRFLIAAALLFLSVAASGQELNEEEYYLILGYKRHFPGRHGFVAGAGSKWTSLFFSYGSNRANPDKGENFSGGIPRGAVMLNDDYVQSYSVALSWNRFSLCPYVGMSLASVRGYDRHWTANAQSIAKAADRDVQRVGAVFGIMTSIKFPVYLQVDYNTAIKRRNIGMGLAIKLPNF